MGVDKNSLTIFDISKGILGEDWEYTFLNYDSDVTFHHIEKDTFRLVISNSDAEEEESEEFTLRVNVRFEKYIMNRYFKEF